eukprot:1929971-Rhodomonas_salina.1
MRGGLHVAAGYVRLRSGRRAFGVRCSRVLRACPRCVYAVRHRQFGAGGIFAASVHSKRHKRHIRDVNTAQAGVERTRDGADRSQRFPTTC